MQLATKYSPNSPKKVTRYLVTAWRFINHKLVLWAFIVWLSFDISLTANSFSIKFSKPFATKVSGLFVATRGSN